MEALEDQRFQRWLQRLQRSTELVAGDFQGLANTIQEHLKTEDAEYPKWIKSISKPTLRKLAPPTDDVKSLLRHVSFPHALEAYNQLSQELTKKDNSDEKNEEPAKTPISPIGDDKAIDLSVVKSYLTSIGDENQDSLVALCKLADIQHRLSRAAMHDKSQISHAIIRETKRSSQTGKTIGEHQNKLNKLQADNETAVFEKCMTALKQEVSDRQDELRKASEEEEAAKRAYEMAMEKKRRASNLVQEVQGVFERADKQRKLLVTIHNVRMDIEKYNQNSSTKRLEILHGLDNVLKTIQSKLEDGSIGEELPGFLSSLTRMFNEKHLHKELDNDSADSTSQHRNISFTAVRIGLELARLWRQLCHPKHLPALHGNIDAFEKTLLGVLAELPRPKPEEEETLANKYDNSTVVLYFDHLLHNTPNDHVESQGRVLTSLKALANQRHLNSSGIPPRTSSGVVNPTANKPLRELKLMNCNDIVSPPLWCLPLVHAPKYLAQLQSLADEAREQDLLVPLEFDTEWESDLVTDSEDEQQTVIRRGRPPANQGLKRFMLPKYFTDRLSSEEVAIIEDILTPTEDDVALEKAMTAQSEPMGGIGNGNGLGHGIGIGGGGAMSGTLIRGKRGRGRPRTITGNAGPGRSSASTGVSSGYIGGGMHLASPRTLDRPRERSPGLSTSGESNLNSERFHYNERVSTPYGDAIVIDEAFRDETTIKLRMSWGATAFMNRRSVQKLEYLDVSGLTRVDFMEVLEERAKDTRYIRDDRNRTSSNPMLHALVLALADRVGKQKTITDALGFYTATLSLYIHGRASVGLINNMETKVIRWIYSVCKLDIDAKFETDPDWPLLVLFEGVRKGDVNGNDMLPSAGESRGYKRRGYHSHHNQGQSSDRSAGNGHSNSNNNSNGDSEALTPSGEADESSAASDDDNGGPGRRRVPKRRRVSAGPVATQGSLVSMGNGEIPIKVTREDEELRDMLTRYMRVHGVSQATLAAQFSQMGVEATQAIVSGWFRYKMRNPMLSRMSVAAAAWLSNNKQFLVESEAVRVDALTVYMRDHYEKVLNNNGDADENAATAQADDDEDDQDGNDDNNNNDATSNVIPPAGDEHGLTLLQEFSMSDSISMESEVSQGSPLFTVRDLQSAVTDEMTRRKVNRSAIEGEIRESSSNGDTNSIIITKKALGQFLSIGALVDSDDARNWARKLLRWVEESRTKPTPLPSLSSRPSQQDACPVCRRPRGSFPSPKSFIIHMNWCRRRQAKCLESSAAFGIHTSMGSPIKSEQDLSAQYMEVPSSGDQMQSQESVDIQVKSESIMSDVNMEVDDAYDNSASSSAIAVSTNSAPATPSNSNRNGGREDVSILVADSFTEGYHYSTCEQCRLGGEMLLCQGCPCGFHPYCIPTESPTKPWFCRRCRDVGTQESRFVLDEEKTPEYLVGKWILVYSALLRRWKQGCIVKAGPRMGLFLFKSIRSDGKGGRAQWVDISQSKVRQLLNPPSISFNVAANKANAFEPKSSLSRVSNGVYASTPSVRFDEVSHQHHHKTSFPMDGEMDTASTINIGRESELNEGGAALSMSDTYISSESLQAALCAAGSACRAVDVVMCNSKTNAFACTRPPGHHAGRYGCTSGCLSTGFCILNNAAIAMVYARARWGLERVAVIDIDVHFGNGTAEILKNDPKAFFASVHMVYGNQNDGKFQDSLPDGDGFYPAHLGLTEMSNNYVSVGVLPAIVSKKAPAAAVVSVATPVPINARGGSNSSTAHKSHHHHHHHHHGGGGGGGPTTATTLAGTPMPKRRGRPPRNSNRVVSHQNTSTSQELVDNTTNNNTTNNNTTNNNTITISSSSTGHSHVPSRLTVDVPPVIHEDDEEDDEDEENNDRDNNTAMDIASASSESEEEPDEQEEQEEPDDEMADESPRMATITEDDEDEAEETAESISNEPSDLEAKETTKSTTAAKEESSEDDSDDIMSVGSEDEDKVKKAMTTNNTSSATTATVNNAVKTSEITEEQLKKMNLRGAQGYRVAIRDIIIPKLQRFNPELIIISAGFDGYQSDPLGGELRLSIDDYEWSTRQLMNAMSQMEGSDCRVISLLEGGYDTAPNTLGLARCVDAHVKTLRSL